jgi:hypothetical protein
MGYEYEGRNICLDSKTQKPYCYSPMGASIYGNPCAGLYNIWEWSNDKKKYVRKTYKCELMHQCGFSYQKNTMRNFAT